MQAPDSAFRLHLDRLNELIRDGGTLSGYERNCAFLNTGGQRFATISAVSGLDFIDDARSPATVDWDRDGDLDLWVANRTAPQLRLLLNQAPNSNRFVAFRLIGDSCNRDAIGARISVVLEGSEPRPLTKTLHAGEGFLGQSSKWVHFGLSAQELEGQSPIAKVHVRWPGGASEHFSGVEPDGWYRLRQGSGTAENVTRSAISIAGSAVTAQSQRTNGERRTFLSARVPSPPLRYETIAGDMRDVELGKGHPVLVNLWASWCLPCIQELSQWKSQATMWRETGLDIVALSVDEIDGNEDATVDQARAVAARLDLPFTHGLATTELYSRLEQLMNWPFRRKLSVPVPVSLLFDTRGQLAAIYRGSVDANTLRADLDRLSLSGRPLHAAALPFPGRWDRIPQPLRPIKIAVDLMDKGDVVDAAEFVRRNYELLAPHKEFGLLSVWLADEFVKLNRTQEAVKFYETALRHDPNNVTIINNLAWQLAAHPDENVRNPPQAVLWAEKARRLTNNENAHVLDTLAVAYASSGNFTKAVQTVIRAQALVNDDAQLTAKFAKRLQLFRNKTAYLDPPAGQK